MKRYALLVAYDGTNYGGWQIQKNAVTVQEKLEAAVGSLTGKKTAVVASGRTDSGVHAAGQVCSFDGEITIPPEKVADALNIILPCDISVIKSVEVPFDFDVNRSAKKKTYRYSLYFASRRNPLKDRYSVHVKGAPDIAKLRHIAGLFEGEHDFKAYCQSGSDVKTTVRRIYSVRVECSETEAGTEVGIFVTGGGFLYNMVRTMVGTMLYFAAGSLTEEDVRRSIETGDRTAVGKTMPANGLTLLNVEYGSEIFL